ncbi:MAG: XAC2610-related protein [Formosimonas sp.]
MKKLIFILGSLASLTTMGKTLERDDLPETGTYAVERMPRLAEHINSPDSAQTTTIVEHPPLFEKEKIPEILWLINPNMFLSDEKIKAQGGLLPLGYIWLNPNLCQRFDNGMPRYPAFTDDLSGRNRLKLLNNPELCPNLDYQYTVQETAPNSRNLIISAPVVKVKQESIPLKDDPRCQALGECDFNAQTVIHQREPQLKFNRFNSSNAEQLLILPHPVPLYHNPEDLIPYQTLPAEAPFMVELKDPRLPKPDNWQLILLPPGLISPEAEPIFSFPLYGSRVREDRAYVKTSDTTTGVWVNQVAQHPLFDFKVSCINNDPRPSTDGIAVYRKGQSQLHQLILGYNGEYTFSACDNQVQLVDVSFDGHLDFSIFAHDGGAGPNSGDFFFIFNPKTQKFDYHEALSNLIATTIDSKRKTITSSWRGSCCDHGSETYTFKNGKMFLLSTWRQYLGADGYSIEETSRRVGGKLQKRVTRERLNEN